MSFLRLVALSATLPFASSAFQASLAAGRPPAGRAAVLRRASAPPLMSEKVVVTDGTDSFFQSRMIFQYLHDFGDFSRVTAFSSSVTEAKKMLLSRQARYSGLVDVLDFAEGGDVELSAALGGASTWIVVNADSKAVVGQLEAAAAAGVKRAFIHPLLSTFAFK